ncbi:hypothetical protein HT031_001112 [Scenedesmus sp. PABB004]|nr:hypothetical protein HT031_001112 [Scenedesmus sp. PABB004]
MSAPTAASLSAPGGVPGAAQRPAARREQQQQQLAQPRTAAQARSSAVALDLAAGTAGGVAQLLVGHPFDTIKVKLQSGSQAFSGPLDAARVTLAREGVKGLYKGMAAPLATVAVFNAVLFASRGQMELLLTHSDGSPLGVRDQLVAAVGASAAVSLVATPTELLKCRLQAQGCSKTAVQRLIDAGQDPTKHTIYRGPRDVARHVLAQRGAAGLFKGLRATLAREALGNMCMFGVYEYAKQRLAASKGVSTRTLGFGDLMLAGGLGGTAFWLGCYPVDVVKSKLQTDSFTAPRYAGMLDCARQVAAADGPAGLWRGFAPALLRSFPANAACFAVYEATRSLLDGLVPR